MTEILQCPVFMMYAASRKIRKNIAQQLEQDQLTYPQYLVMSSLLEKDGCSVDELGKKLFLDSGTLTPVLKRLEAKGFILRGRNPKDERRLIVKLTAIGQAFEARSNEVRATVAQQFNISRQEIEQLKITLTKLLVTN